MDSKVLPKFEEISKFYPSVIGDKNKKPKTIPLDISAEPTTTFSELFFRSVFSSIKSEIYFLCSNNSCWE